MNSEATVLKGQFQHSSKLERVLRTVSPRVEANNALQHEDEKLKISQLHKKLIEFEEIMNKSLINGEFGVSDPR